MAPPTTQPEASEPQPDPFAEAQGAPFATPLSHWAMHWREARWFPRWARPLLGSLIEILLSQRITIPHGFSFAPEWTWRTCSAEEETAARLHWETLPLPSPVLWLTLGYGFEERFAIRVHGPSSEQLNFVLLLTHKGKRLAYASRTLDLATRFPEVHAHFFVVSPKFRDYAVGAQLMANSLVFYRDLNVRAVFIAAGLTTGGAVWAKFGYRPIDGAEWAKVKKVIQSNFTALYSKGLGNVYAALTGQSLEQAVAAILGLDDPNAIWMVTSLDPGGMVAREAGLHRPGGLAAALLQRSRWRGILDLTDPLALDKLRAYIQHKIHQGDVMQPPGW